MGAGIVRRDISLISETIAECQLDFRRSRRISAIHGELLTKKISSIVGSNNPPDVLSSVERYDPLTNSWTTVAPMSTARERHAVAVLDGKLYACGGWKHRVDLIVNANTALTSVERYDPDTNTWETVAPMKTARSESSAAVLDGKLYVAGGQSELFDMSATLSTVERYDPSANVWEEVPPMIKARSNFVLCSFD